MNQDDRKKLDNDESPTRELPDLSVNQDQAEEAKGGSISLNFTKVEFKNIGMGTAND